MFDRQEFWKDPAASNNLDAELIRTCRPEFYLELEPITRLIVGSIKKYCRQEMSVLEVGCGTGRNLAGLVRAGFNDVSGIEISQRAVDIGRDRFPEYREVDVIVAPVEDVIEQLQKFDVIYTQSCLMHLPYDLDWVIEIIKDRAEHMVLTNEGEPRKDVLAWSRNYEEYITKGGKWRQVEMKVGRLPLPPTTIKRVFLRADDG